MAIDIRAEYSIYILDTISCFYLLPPPHRRSSAENRISWLQTQACILHRGSTSHRSGWDKANASCLSGIDKAELLFLSCELLPDTARTEEWGQPCPTEPKPSPTAAIPLLVGKGGTGCLLYGFCCPCQASVFSNCLFCTCMKPLKGGGEFAHSMVNPVLSRTGAVKTLKML